MPAGKKRAKGYHYAVRANGTKYRVYTNGYKKPSKPGAKNYSGYKVGNYKKKGYSGSSNTGVRRTAAVNSNKYATQTPMMSRSRNGVLVCHREYITDVPSATEFKTLELDINPGLPDSFPWLARVAQNFEEYVPKKIMFEFRTTSSDTLIAASPALGSVIMATQYNSLSAIFGSKQEMENYEGAVSCKPSLSCKHYVQTARGKTVLNELYIRTGDPVASGDVRLYDMGRFTIACGGMQTADQTIGELWVSYEIELRKPRIPTDPIVSVAHFRTPDVAGFTAIAPFGPDGTVTLPRAGSSLDAKLVGLVAGSGGRIDFGPKALGYYKVDIFLPVSVNSNTGVWASTNFVNCVLYPTFPGNATAFQQSDAASTTVRTSVLSFVVNITQVNASCRVANSQQSAGVSSDNTPGDIWITEIPDVIT